MMSFIFLSPAFFCSYGDKVWKSSQQLFLLPREHCHASPEWARLIFNVLLFALQNGVSPNFQFEDNLGPLHLAAKNGNTQCAFYLLQFNANPNMISKVRLLSVYCIGLTWFLHKYSYAYNTVSTTSKISLSKL